MAALRAIVLLLAVSAVCAGKISGSVRATGVQRAVNEATRHIDSQIAEIENYGVITDVIDEGLEKLKELVEKIKEKVQGAEAALLKAIKKATENVAERLNNLIEKATGLDLHLEDKLEDFEKKTENCANELRDKVRKTLLAIKTDAETCAAPQIAEAKKLTQEIRKLIELIESVPVNTVNSIKQCVNPKPITTTTPVPETTTTPVPETTTTPVPETTTTPVPETTTPAEPETTTPAEPETTTPAEPETTTPAQPETTTPAQPETTTPAQPETTTAQADDAGEATTLAPQDDQSDVASNVVVVDFSNRKPSLHGISDIFEKVKCVTEALAKAVVDLKDAPKLVYYLDKEIRDLASKETQKTLKKCAVQAVSGRGKELQTDAAELAYCLIAPSSSSDSDESGEH